jgi:hypothetical protein
LWLLHHKRFSSATIYANGIKLAMRRRSNCPSLPRDKHQSLFHVFFIARPRSLNRCCRCAFDIGARLAGDGPGGTAARAHAWPAMLARATPSNTA